VIPEGQRNLSSVTIPKLDVFSGVPVSLKT
jgi:hypothetical protein